MALAPQPHEIEIKKALADDAARPRWSSGVAVTTAILAALAAISSLLASHHSDAAMLDQIQASDQWNYYQAKGIKLAVLESKTELLPALAKDVSDSDKERLARYKSEQEGIFKEASGKQKSSEDHRRRHGTCGIAVTFFQIGIALAAVSLLVRKDWFWYCSLVCGAIGGVVLTLGLWPAS